MKNSEEILDERLKQCGISKSEFVEKVKGIYDEECAIIIYTSHLEGLGNKNSDFDIYVLSKELPKGLVEIGNHKLLMCKINKVVCDIEFWKYDQLENMLSIDSISNDKDKLKFLKRLESGVLLSGKEIGKAYKQKIELLKLDEIIVDYFISCSNEEYDDAIKMFKANNFICCINCARRSLDYAIAALSAKNNHANLNIKWIPKIITDNKGFGNSDIIDKYLSYQIYSNVSEENIENYLEEFLEFISEILINLSLN